MNAVPHSDPPSPLPLPDDPGLRAVDRAMAAARRGEPVAVQGTDGAVWLAMAVEMVGEESPGRLERLAGGRSVLAVTRRRALALGLAATATEGGSVVLLTKQDASVEGTADSLTAAEVLALADPEHRTGATLAAGLKVSAAAPGSAPAAAVDLARLGRLLPAMLIARIPEPQGDAAVRAARHDLLCVRADDLALHRSRAARTLRRVADAAVPLAGAETTRIVAFRPADGGPEHLAIVIGTPDPAAPVLARLHSECFTGDLLASLRCDCGEQLRGAIAEIARAGSGVLLYLAQEGRGIGLVNKLRAYRLQDGGFDTLDANEMLGFEADERVYLPAAEMLRQLGFGRVRLMTNNPEKLSQLAACGIEVVERVPHVFAANGHNDGYLRTKAERGGHLF